MSLTPQQTRNLMRQLQGATTQQRTKVLLEAFAEVEDNDVLLVQDQMDITCVIAMQTAIKNLLSAMGRHDSDGQESRHKQLGMSFGLVAPSATGRGIPLIAFLALDQQLGTMQRTIEFFKRRNPLGVQRNHCRRQGFRRVESIGKVFPDAKVILCQFHALTYWRKIYRRPKFILKVTQRDAIETALTKLIYWYYVASYRSFDSESRKTCEVECPQLLQYFLSIGKLVTICEQITYFSVDNTTTNRIKSNWNQVNLLLGMKPRLDATICDLLAHQATIARQLQAVMHKHSTTSRQADAVPKFLPLVSKNLSDFSLGKVRAQWGFYMEYMSIFHHLPCQHLMYSAEHVYRFENLSVSAIIRHLDMVATVEMDKKF
ncbi:hypothetical protein PHPALM_30871 [Phytophthora palmivora]|uniref:MULE transposase domain-containing protein n=1 Tax=Phytophthora palmivora TaxID=4796 RepID=A0A2P4X420_9STRA|nr:hypothetical protein PHPALM_30871 [Phytophthora palmivora]